MYEDQSSAVNSPRSILRVHYKNNKNEYVTKEFYNMNGTAGAEAFIRELKLKGEYFWWEESFPNSATNYI